MSRQSDNSAEKVKGRTKIPAKAPLDIRSRIGHLAEGLRAAGLYKAKDFKAAGVPAAQMAEAIELLAGMGFEAIKGGVRVDLRTQIKSLLSDRNAVPISAAAKLLKGSNATEIKAIGQLLAKTGEIKLALRGKAECICEPSSPLLSREELKTLKAMGDFAGKVLKPGIPRSLLREDVREALLDLVTSKPSHTTHQTSDSAPSDPNVTSTSGNLKDALLKEIQRLTRPTGLCYVPELVLALTQTHPLSAIHECLLLAARDGILELQVESGLDRLSHVELALCPEGLRQSRLSWAKLRESK